MILCNNKNPKHQQLFREMYKAYNKELSQYSLRLKECLITPNDIYNILIEPELERHFITEETGKPIGFCLIGFNKNKHPETDWYIAEFYIQPEYRRKGYGKKTFGELLKTHPGKYCYFVLKQNEGAKAFWTKLREEHKCIDLKKNLMYSHTPCDCTFEAFSTTD